jgi:hypothetical protein
MKFNKIIQSAKKAQSKIIAAFVALLFFQIGYSQNQSIGALEITPAQYALLPKANWTEIKSYSTVVPSPEGTYGANGITMLNVPPVGDQGT